MSGAPPPITIEHVPLGRLVLDPANPRRITDGMLDALSASVGEFGLIQPILARRADSTVIAGHQRLVAARRQGLPTVPVIWLDLSPQRARLLALALNRIAGTWDEDMLSRLLADLDAVIDIDITLSGFGADELQALLGRFDAAERRERIEDFDADEAIGVARLSDRTATGDLWRLGDHRLLVGDATDAADVARVLDGGRAAMAFTDPPYGVALGDHGGHQRGTRRRRIANDALPREAWEAFVAGWVTQLLASVDGALYICMSCQEWPTVSRILADAGAHWSTTIAWAKDRFVLGRADYQRGWEPIWFGWRDGSSHHWCGARDQSDVWTIPRPSDSPLHPTMKPLELMERAIENSSRPGDLVFDPFAGSGSTLIACERTGRRCAAIEIDTMYAATVIGRWERFTGRTAERIEPAHPDAVRSLAITAGGDR